MEFLARSVPLGSLQTTKVHIITYSEDPYAFLPLSLLPGWRGGARSSDFSNVHTLLVQPFLVFDDDEPLVPPRIFQVKKLHPECEPTVEAVCMPGLSHIGAILSSLPCTTEQSRSARCSLTPRPSRGARPTRWRGSWAGRARQIGRCACVWLCFGGGESSDGERSLWCSPTPRALRGSRPSRCRGSSPGYCRVVGKSACVWLSLGGEETSDGGRPLCCMLFSWSWQSVLGTASAKARRLASGSYAASCVRLIWRSLR